jgi:hypothetical protein
VLHEGESATVPRACTKTLEEAKVFSDETEVLTMHGTTGRPPYCTRLWTKLPRVQLKRFPCFPNPPNPTRNP